MPEQQEKLRGTVILSADVKREQDATMAAWEALRLLSPGARSRALNWLDAWAREEADPRATGRDTF